MTKLLENTYRAVNIALADEFAGAATELEVDVIEVIEAAATKPTASRRFTRDRGGRALHSVVIRTICCGSCGHDGWTCP
jgi:hypothetical protein